MIENNGEKLQTNVRTDHKKERKIYLHLHQVFILFLQLDIDVTPCLDLR